MQKKDCVGYFPGYVMPSTDPLMHVFHYIFNFIIQHHLSNKPSGSFQCNSTLTATNLTALSVNDLLYEVFSIPRGQGPRGIRSNNVSRLTFVSGLLPCLPKKRSIYGVRRFNKSSSIWDHGQDAGCSCRSRMRKKRSCSH